MIYYNFIIFILLVFSTLCSGNEVLEITIQDKHDLLSLEGINQQDSIDTESIKNSSPDSMDDVLKLSSGITTTGGPRSSSEAPQIRGLNSNKIYIYVDGVKQSFRTDHSTMIPINTALLKSVSISKSPFSSLNKNSLGGGVSFETMEPSDFYQGKRRSGVDLNIGNYRENNELKSSTTYFDKVDELEYFLNLTSAEAENSKLSDGSTLQNSSYNEKSVTSKITLNNSKNNKSKISLEHFKRNDTSPINPTLNPPENLASLNGENETIRNTIGISQEKKKEKIQLYYTKQEQTKVRDSDKQTEVRAVETTGLAYDYIAFENSRQKLLTGLELTQDRLFGSRDSKDLESYPEGESTNNGIYLNHQSNHLSKKLRAVLGTRIDNYKLRGASKSLSEKNISYVSNKIGTEYKVNNSFSIGASYSEGLNAPRIQDVYVDGLHHKGDGFFFKNNYFIPNESLKPETSDVFEYTVQYENEGPFNQDFIVLKAQYYKNYINNYITTEKIDRSVFDEENGTTQFINIPKVETNGYDISGEYYYKRHSYKLNYAQVRGKNLSQRQWIADMPADQYDFFYTFEYKNGFSFGLHSLWAQEQGRVNPETTQRTESTEEYNIHNLFLKREYKKGTFKGLTVQARIDNISDVEYRRHGSNIKEKGQDFKLTLNYRYYF